MPPTLSRVRRRLRQDRTPLGRGQVLLGAALTVGLVLRVAPVLGAGFPLLDGGLFATMANDIREAHFSLPQYSSFNLGNVPFAYPPLGLYILAAIPGDPISTERWLPVLYSMLSIGVAYLLARELLDEEAAGLTSLFFAAMPVAWAIEGGSVTRGLGLLLLLTALWRFLVLLRSQTALNALLAGLTAGLALLAHPGVGPTGVASGALLLLFQPTRSRLLVSAGAALIAALIISPWVTLVLVRYGPSPFVTAASVPHGIGDSLLRILTVGPSWINPFDFVGPLAILGVVLTIKSRDLLLPVWALLLVGVPGAPGRNAAIVWAMLAALGAVALWHAAGRIGASRLATAVGAIWIVAASFISGYQRYTPIPPAVRAAMVAAGRDTSPGARFAIVSQNDGLRGLALDWFPTLSGRISVATSMGLEWTTPETFRSAIELDQEIQGGEIPGDVTATFTITRGSASWRTLR